MNSSVNLINSLVLPSASKRINLNKHLCQLKRKELSIMNNFGQTNGTRVPDKTRNCQTFNVFV